MQIISDFTKDVQTPDKGAGGYEWWYFDALDIHSDCSLVIIFYQGNPFSRRYIGGLSDGTDALPALPEQFPAISISIYEGDQPVYYSFTEFDERECLFSAEKPFIQTGQHQMTGEYAEGEQIYEISLEEELASGHGIRAELTFRSSSALRHLFTGEDAEASSGHCWNLVQPRAEVKGTIGIFTGETQTRDIRFKGTGYHDHNLGQEPMKNEFKDWYWGRFHFEGCTLVYYIMNRQRTSQHRAWLIEDHKSTVIREFTEAHMEDKEFNLFGLQPVRKLILGNGDTEVIIQQSRVLDNGPFYQRFVSDAFLVSAGGGTIQKSRGITEYIYPARIHWRMFWPLVNMRIRYKKEKPHWVQKSGLLYRWTW